MFKVVSKLEEQGEEQRFLTSEKHLSGIELEEAKAFVRVSTAALTGQSSELNGESSSSAPVLKRSRSAPSSDPETCRQSSLKRPRQYASLSELGKVTFGTSSYKNTTFSALPSLQLRLGLGDPRLQFPYSNYSLNNFSVSESCSDVKPSDEECAFVNQAILRAEQLKNDDSSFHRLIDRMMLEEQQRVTDL
jgi:hypothetical protein